MLIEYFDYEYPDHEHSDYQHYEFDCSVFRINLEALERSALTAHRWAVALRLVLDTAITELASIEAKNTELPRLLDTAKLFADTISHETNLIPSDGPDEPLTMPVWSQEYTCVYGNKNCPYSADCTPPLTDADCPPPPEEDFCD